MDMGAGFLQSKSLVRSRSRFRLAPQGPLKFRSFIDLNCVADSPAESSETHIRLSVRQSSSSQTCPGPPFTPISRSVRLSSGISNQIPQSITHTCTTRLQGFLESRRTSPACCSHPPNRDNQIFELLFLLGGQ